MKRKIKQTYKYFDLSRTWKQKQNQTLLFLLKIKIPHTNHHRAKKILITGKFEILYLGF